MQSGVCCSSIPGKKAFLFKSNSDKIIGIKIACVSFNDQIICLIMYKLLRYLLFIHFLIQNVVVTRDQMILGSKTKKKMQGEISQVAPFPSTARITIFPRNNNYNHHHQHCASTIITITHLSCQICCLTNSHSHIFTNRLISNASSCMSFLPYISLRDGTFHCV